MNKATILGLLSAMFVSCSIAATGDTEDYKQELQVLKDRIEELERRIEESEDQIDEVEETATTDEGPGDESAEEIDIGGAVRFQYAYRDFDESGRDRGGDLELDTVRLNFDGTLGGVKLSAEYRFYEFMDVIHHAWAGYDFQENLALEVGVTQVPFGILPFSSHNFFFSSNYYIGLEDDYDFGAKTVYQPGNWDIRLAFFKNDEITFGSDTDRYSYDIISDVPDNDGDFLPDGNDIEENNTFNVRLAYNLSHGVESNSEIGISGQYGSLYNDTGDSDAGNYKAAAVHLDGVYGPWRLMMQVSRQDYELINGREQLASGAYAATFGFPAEANSYLLNLAYDLPVSIGPITMLRFYNDFTYITDKPDDLSATWQNVLGMSVASGGLFTYFDLIRAENQPFIGGDFLGDGNPETRFNINVGYYF